MNILLSKSDIVSLPKQNSIATLLGYIQSSITNFIEYPPPPLHSTLTNLDYYTMTTKNQLPLIISKNEFDVYIYTWIQWDRCHKWRLLLPVPPHTSLDIQTSPLPL